ncbi:MAG: outer membrane beta-barrel protein [Candidatus Kapabacteria bacterium]|nr:outer membrane beta-barrel protein [Candidatus Kapabacteria bacterium]
MKYLIRAVFLLTVLCGSLPAFGQDEPYTYQAAAKKDRIALDGGLIFPFGSVSTGLDLKTAWGINLNFWKFISDRSFGVVTIGNSFYSLGGEVQTDSGLIDLTGFTMNATPLLGGIGYAFGDGDLHPYVIIHGGATFITVNIGENRPSEQINNEAYFTLAGTAGVGYGVTDHLSFMFSGRYTKMFGEDLQSIALLFGVSYRL